MPGATDDVIIADSAAQHSIDDITAVKSLTVDSSYTTVTIQVDKLTISNKLTFNAGTIEGAQNPFAPTSQINLPPWARLQWSGGTFDYLAVNLSEPLDSTHSIEGSNDKVLRNNATLNLQGGTIVWTGSGNIRAQDTASIRIENATIGMREVAGILDIQTDASMTSQGGTNSLNNLGTMRRTLGAGTTQIALDFRNSGTFELRSGIVGFSAIALQAAPGALTTLTGGSNLNVTQANDGSGDPGPGLFGGRLDGVGTITGNLIVGDNPPAGGPGAPGAMSPPVDVHPGVGDGVGRLNIVGNFTLNRTGRLIIEVQEPASGVVFSSVSVQGDSNGGLATVDGFLKVNNSAATPHQGRFPFLVTTGGICGGFDGGISYAVILWDGSYTFRCQKTDDNNSFELVVVFGA